MEKNLTRDWAVLACHVYCHVRIATKAHTRLLYFGNYPDEKKGQYQGLVLKTGLRQFV